MRVLPGVVAVVVTAVAVALAGCSQFDAALGQRQAVVAFKPDTPVSQRLAVRSACAKVPEVKAPPVPSDLNSPYALQQLTFRIDHATNADVARLEKCLAKFPSVVGVTLQDSSDMGG
jgi:glucose/arabinose dehydrogenase